MRSNEWSDGQPKYLPIVFCGDGGSILAIEYGLGVSSV